MIRYKLVDRQFRTHAGEKNETVWQLPDGSHPKVKASGVGHALCTCGVVHSYASPPLAAMMNTIHSNIVDPICIEVEAGPLVADDGTKGGHKWARMVREVPLPVPTARQRTIFAILCVRAIPGRALTPELSIGREGWADRYLAAAVARTALSADAVARAAALAAEAAARTVDAVPGAPIDFAALAQKAMEIGDVT